MGILKKLIIWSAFIFTFTVQANRHEHFASWPTASSIIEGYEKAYGESIGKLKAKDLLKVSQVSASVTEEEVIASALKQIFTKEEINSLKHKYNIFDRSLSEKAQNIKLGKAIKDKSLDELIVGMKKGAKKGYSIDSKKHKQNLKRFFKFDHDGPQGKDAYMTLEKIRIRTFLLLKNKGKSNKYRRFLLDAFDRSLNKIPIVNREFIGVSVPSEFFDRDLKALKELFKSKGSDVDFYYSYPRAQLTRANNKGVNFDERIALIKQSLNEGWGDGVDITGSINEENTKSGLSGAQRTQMQNRLTTLIQTLDGSEDTVLRFHAFEGRNDGRFYEEMYKMIEKISSGELKMDGKPPVISIGHIAKISDEDIEHLKQIKEQAKANKVPFNIVFDANFMSNERLQGSNPQKIASVVAKLQDAGFEVGLGSDGTGILGKKSSVPWQANALFDNGTSENRIFEITDNSAKAPVCDISYLEKMIGEFK